MKKISYPEIAKGKPGSLEKPTYADVVMGKQHASNSSGKCRRIYYPDWDALPEMSRQDPRYVDYDNNIIGMHGDGNCMFRAIAFAVDDPQLDHAVLRRKVCDKEADDNDIRALFADLDVYLRSMRKLGEYGGEPELKTAAVVINRRICVWENGRLTSHYGTSDQHAIHLRYDREHLHYDLHIVAPAEVPPSTQQETIRQSQLEDAKEDHDDGGGWVTVIGRRNSPKKSSQPRVMSETTAGIPTLTEFNKYAILSEEKPEEKPATSTTGNCVPEPVGGGTEHAQKDSEKYTTKPDKSGPKTRPGRPKKRRRVPPPPRPKAFSTTSESVSEAILEISLHVNESVLLLEAGPNRELDTDDHKNGQVANGLFSSEAKVNECRISSQNILPQDASCFSREVGSQMDIVNDTFNPAQLVAAETNGRNIPPRVGRRPRKRQNFDRPPRRGITTEPLQLETSEPIVTDTHHTATEPRGPSEAEVPTDSLVSNQLTNKNISEPASEPNIQDTVEGRHNSSPADFIAANYLGAIRASTLTRAMLDEFIDKCPYSIVIEKVLTDLSTADDCNLDGPWSYRDSKKVIVTYILGDSGEKRQISLCNLRPRGFGGPSRSGLPRYKFYSWLRFKDTIKKAGHTPEGVLDDETLFHETLRKVDHFYSSHPRRAEEEGLQPHSGPQSWDDRYNLLQLHYYGRGWHKFYRLSTFREIFISRHGAARWAEFQADPWIDTCSEQHFELLLSDVHNKLRDTQYRYTHLLDAYAGPQCHEDRGTAVRIQYNVMFITHSTTAGTRQKARPVAQAPPQHTVSPPTADTSDLAAFFLRSCMECGTLRVLDARAAAKYPLGQYTYADRRQPVRFTCDRLVGISCDTPPDFMACTPQDKPSTWVAIGTQTAGDTLPPPAIQLRSLRVLDTSDHTEETEIVARYHYRGDSRAVGWTGRRSILTRTSNSGIVSLGTTATKRRRRFRAISSVKFTAGRFTVDYPREAKCCQPWHDPLDIDPEDPSTELQITNLQVLRDIHALYDSLRRVRCIKCNQQTPGLPYADHQIRVPVRGHMTDLSPDSIVSGAVASSVLLKAGGRCSVTLDPKFRGANGTAITDRDASGVCTGCSPAFIVDADNNVVPRPLASDVRPDPDDADDFVGDEHPAPAAEPPARGEGDAAANELLGDNEEETEPVHISLFSAANLVATDIYSDDAYRLFVRSWTHAETMVLRPIHLVVSVLRLRANQVPFCKHGTIAYPLKDACRARNLPWYDFETLPFVVLVQNRRDGTSAEAMINMQTILRAKHFMERTMQCKYNPQQTRPFYRFVSEQWTPFSNDNLAELQRRLSEPDRASTPAGLRVVLASDIHARADKALRFNEFCNWLESGFAMADELWKSFRLSRCGEGADTTEAGQDDLWEVIENYVVGRAVDTAAENHREQEVQQHDDDGESDTGEIDVTMRHVLDCAVSNGWLLAAAADGDDTGEPSNVLLRCCEELEMLGREFGNDEGNRAGGISAGAVTGPQTERPEDIRRQGISRSALLHVQMPGVDRENPLPEATPGYMQMAFPEVFRSGDADPHQDRKVSIRQPVTSWRQNWLHWMSRQPEAEGNVDFQFVVSNQLSRDKTGQEAKVAIRMADFPDGLPTKEQLMNDPVLCKKVAQSLLCLRTKMEDSDAFWRVRKQEAIGIIRYLEDPPPWRSDDIPLEVYLWQTRAVPYNHHPAIHRLCDNAAVNEALSDERYLSARLGNTLRHPGIVAWMSAFIGEMDTLALAAARYGATSYLARSEWGANANPHIHRHIISESFSRFLQQLRNSLKRKVADLERDLRAEDPALESDVSRSAVETQVEAAWRDCQQQYIAHISRCYTNWNAGFTKTGERTFDFAYDRKTTVCRARMAAMLDGALSTGDFVSVDELYVRVINGTLRHTGHSGRGDAPSAKDGCGVRRLVIDKTATAEARAAGRPGPVKKQVIVCKRRMPRRLRSEGAVAKDAHDPRLYQCETPTNDKWIGGHDPFTVLHILNNIDDKAVVPAWLTRAPRVSWTSSSADGGGYEFDVELPESNGVHSVEYALKYTFKPMAPIRTPSDILLSALERREAGDNVDHGVVKRMYNQASSSACQSIFQVMHKNWQLPLQRKNVDVRGFNLSGCRMLKPATAAADPVYVYADAVERFNARLGENIVHGNIPRGEIQREMSVFEFCDTFTSVETTVNGQKVFRIGRRRSTYLQERKCVMLLPHHSQSNANPARPQFWKYARDTVLWNRPCWVSDELMPPADCVTDDDIAAHWRNMYEALMKSNVYTPLWTRRYHKKHRGGAADDEQSSDESDGGNESDGAADDVAQPDVDEERQLHAERVRDRFYQTALDAMLGCPPEDVDDAEQRADRAAASVANPAGYDFQSHWLGDRVVNPDHVRRNYARLATMGAGEASHSVTVTPSGRQLVLPHIVSRYVSEQREWRRSCREWNAYDRAMNTWRRSRSSHAVEPVPPSVADIRDRPPKALRAFLLGDPGEIGRASCRERV